MLFPFPPLLPFLLTNPAYFPFCNHSACQIGFYITACPSSFNYLTLEDQTEGQKGIIAVRSWSPYILEAKSQFHNGIWTKKSMLLQHKLQKETLLNKIIQYNHKLKPQILHKTNWSNILFSKKDGIAHFGRTWLDHATDKLGLVL